MQAFLLFTLLIGTLAAPTTTSQQPNASASVAAFQKTYENNVVSQFTSACNTSNIRVRKSWSALTTSERLQYLHAVSCLSKKPSLTDPSLCPGCRNRRDDFTYSHINQTNYIHQSGLFLPWHREFIQQYENALHEECGLKIGLPYWDWAEHSDNQTKSPVFDGSPTSFGSNGAYIPPSSRAPYTTDSILNITVNGSAFSLARDPGTGGGCVTDGFFHNLTLNIGPVTPSNNAPDNVWGTKYNPRCMTRDIDNTLSAQQLNYTVVSNVLSQPDIHSFHTLLENTMHPSSHSSIGGALFDFYSSPNDPAFFLLHSMHDRVWTVWQGQDFAARTNGVDGTVTVFNSPPSENATLSTMMKFVAVSPDVAIGTVMKTVGAPGYCYMYQ